MEGRSTSRLRKGTKTSGTSLTLPAHGHLTSFPWRGILDLTQMRNCTSLMWDGEIVWFYLTNATLSKIYSQLEPTLSPCTHFAQCHLELTVEERTKGTYYGISLYIIIIITACFKKDWWCYVTFLEKRNGRGPKTKCIIIQRFNKIVKYDVNSWLFVYCTKARIHLPPLAVFTVQFFSRREKRMLQSD